MTKRVVWTKLYREIPLDIRKDTVLRGMGGIQMNMAFERRTELGRHQDSRCLCASKAAMGPPITAGKC